MSDSITNVAIFGATGMTGLATLPQAVAAGEKFCNPTGSIGALNSKPEAKVIGH